MYAERHSITFTTHSSAGTVTAYTDKEVTGRILQVQYVKDDLANGSTITLTGNTTGIPIMAISAMNASATHLPRRATTDQDGAAITYDQTAAGQEGVHQINSIRDVSEKLAVQLVGDGFAEYVGSVEKEGEPEAESLDDMKHKDLQAMCKKKGLSAKGSRDTLIERLLAKEQAEDDADDQPPVDENTTIETPENTAVRTGTE